ncbi:hypothetical protein DRN50_06445 [Thermococci archaeon]|nr:MAG: hypothetical protein DRN50_06445 [Thermococci archaeon]
MDKELLISLAVVGEAFGVRPSALLEWNDPEEWVERLAFDSLCLTELRKVEEKELKKTVR